MTEQPPVAHPHQRGAARFPAQCGPSARDCFPPLIGIGGCLAAPPLPHHLAKRHDWLIGAVDKRLREEFGKLQVEINDEKSRICVVDRLIQQAMLQVLQERWDPTFSEHSYGFQAVAQAQSYIADGYNVVVDLDLEKFFDRVNHDSLMARVAARVFDKAFSGPSTFSWIASARSKCR